ncbi:hypothetical protein niasHT_028533 [Heterodera trifolii]|uniref:Uncharacterized protein n=1 Tax=Heterodera trifolii TaxID=157864 RepID=A0ABD2KPX6_9BILA
MLGMEFGGQHDGMQLKKYDIAQRSGEGAVRYSQVDNVVLGIVGRDSSVIKGLNVNDTEEDLNLNLDEGNDDEEAAAGKDIELVSTGQRKAVEVAAWHH